MNTTFVAQFGRYVLNAVLFIALCGCLDANIFAADPQPIDFNRAQQLFNKAKQGEKLSPEDQAYLDRAKAARRKGQKGEVAKAGEKGKPGRGHTAPPPPRESTGLIPLDQMTAQNNYKGQDGGLYGGGKNEPPAAHLKAALAEARKIVPLDERGKPSPRGKIVLLSLGMSNTTMEYSVFKTLADADPAKSPLVAIVDAAQSGKDAAKWSDANSPMWQIADGHLKRAGVTPQQVQAVWCKQARIDPAKYGAFPKHNEEMNEHLVTNLQIAKQRYPNLRIVYLSTRIYGGYALTGLNPEPYAYENGFAIRDLILRQIKGDAALNYDPAKGEVKAPLLLWGPYLWADGLTPRKSDGLVWKMEDFRENDRTHPSVESGREKVAKLLLNLLKTDPTSTPWFLAAGVSGASAADAPQPATTSARGTQAVAHLTGLVWMVGKTRGGRLDGAAIEKVLDANPHISGLFLGASWSDVEPARGVFDWKSLDARVEAARRKGRFYKLSFKPGTGTPDWVYAKHGDWAAGAVVFEAIGPNPYRNETYGKPVRIPLPWDPVFLDDFEQFIRAAGHRYASDPLCAAVAITGANFESDEAHLPKSPKEIERWEALGYREKLPKAYERYMDIFAEAFPRQQLCLHISTAVHNNDGVMEKAVSYGARRYPDRFTLQNCQLNGRNDNSHLYSYALIQKYAGKLHVGYQSLAYLGEGERGSRQGDPRTSVANFVRGHGEYWELWDGNGRDPVICQWVLGEIAKARGGSAAKPEIADN